MLSRIWEQKRNEMPSQHVDLSVAFLTFITRLQKSRPLHMNCLSMASAAKTNLKKIENAQRRILRAIFFQKINMKSVGTNLRKEIVVLTVFELYTMEVFREVFKQIKLESPLCFRDGIGLCQYDTRRKRKKVYYPWPIVEQLLEPNQWTTDWKKHIIGWKTMI